MKGKHGDKYTSAAGRGLSPDESLIRHRKGEMKMLGLKLVRMRGINYARSKLELGRRRRTFY